MGRASAAVAKKIRWRSSRRRMQTPAMDSTVENLPMPWRLGAAVAQRIMYRLSVQVGIGPAAAIMAPLGRRLLVRATTTRPAAAAAATVVEAITVVAAEAITPTLHMAAVAATTTAAHMA